MFEGNVSADFVILAHVMSPDTPSSQPSGRERREFYRITVLLPICIHHETDDTVGECTENLSTSVAAVSA